MKRKKERARTPNRAVSNVATAVLLALVTMAVVTWRIGAAGSTGTARAAGVSDAEVRAWAERALVYAEAFVRRLAELVEPDVTVEFSAKVVVTLSLVLLFRFALRGRSRRRSARSSTRY